MNVYRIKSKQPNCKTCGKPLREWNPFVTEHEHIECTSNNVANSIMKLVKRNLENT